MARYLELETESTIGWDGKSAPPPPSEPPPEEQDKMPKDWFRGAAVALCVGCVLMGFIIKWGSTSASIPNDIPTTAMDTRRQEIMVSVAGEVRQPGVVKLPAGTRVMDAIKAAGGFTERADQMAVNLAAKLHDEQMIRVPRQGEPAPSLTPDASATPGEPSEPGEETPTSPQPPPQAQASPDAPLTPSSERHFQGGVVDAIDSHPTPGGRVIPRTPPEPVAANTPSAPLTPAPESSPTVAAPPPASRVSINRATVEQLERVPGLSPREAADIVAYRKGPPPRAFMSIDELQQVPSLKQANLAPIAPYLKL